jgi:SPW repeat
VVKSATRLVAHVIAFRSSVSKYSRCQSSLGRLDTGVWDCDLLPLPFLSRRREEIAIADWIVTALGFLTLANPFLYSYFNMTVAAWNNVIIGSVVFVLAAYQDWKDSAPPRVKQRHRNAHS